MSLSYFARQRPFICSIMTKALKGSKRHAYADKFDKLNSVRISKLQADGVTGARSLTHSARRVSTPPLTESVPLDTPKFTDLANHNLLDPRLVQTLTEDLSFERMMPVQAATLHELLANRVDCLAQAKTGTGKTVAFLLPAIQTLINRNRTPGSDISLLAISPTRELALQIAKEAKQLMQRLPKYKVCVAIGGTNKNREQSDILSGCDILVGTPGRLLDHLNESKVREKLQALDTLVLDEADRLLDMGFMDDLKKIVGYLPDKVATNRQGMLFSATIAPHVEKVAHLVLASDYKFISTISKGDLNTHEHVRQSLITVPSFADLAPALIGSINAELKNEGPNNLKVIVFVPTAALAEFYNKILRGIQLPDFPAISVLHSRLSQSKRTSITNNFREAKSGILIATDVIARGMDFPAVTNVIQVGIPQEKESYIHRLGRTARAGAKGRGTFIITKYESFFPKSALREIKFEDSSADLNSKNDVLQASEKMEPEFHKRVYQGWLGYYKNHLKGLNWDKERLVSEANKFAAEALGTPETPSVVKSVVSKMGLRAVKGLNVVPDPPRQTHGRSNNGSRSEPSVD